MCSRPPAESSLLIKRRSCGSVRYLDITLRPGRDGAAARLLAEQTAPFIGQRPIVLGQPPPGVRPFCARRFLRSVLTCYALRLAAFRGGCVGVVSPGGDAAEALRFIPYARVKLFTPLPCEGFGCERCATLEGLDECDIILSFSGLAGLGLPDPAAIARSVIFTDSPDFWRGGTAVDGIEPRLPPAILPGPEGVEDALYAAACWELCGMYGLALLPPRRLTLRGLPLPPLC